MTKIDAIVRAVLKSAPAITAMVGDRIYVDRAPMGARLPYITISKPSEIPDKDVPGAYEARIQVSCWSNPALNNGMKDPTEVEAISEAVLSSINHASLQYLNEQWAVGTTRYQILRCRCINAPRYREAVSDYYHIPCDFMIKFRK